MKFGFVLFLAGFSALCAFAQKPVSPAVNPKAILQSLETASLEKSALLLDSLGVQGLPADARLLRHTGWTAAYSTKYRQPYWVCYRLGRSDLYGSYKPGTGFRADTLLTGPCADSADYQGSGFDRGQLAPPMDLRWSKKALDDCFLYSNVSPQVPELNRGSWYKLERTVREWTIGRGDLMVISGPVLNQQFASLQRGSYRVSVPRYFFKIVVQPDTPQPQAIAFLLPNKNVPFTLSKYVTTVDTIELLTGIDFLPGLEDGTEAQLESRSDLYAWDPDHRDETDSIADKDFGKGKLNSVQARDHIGEYATVCGRVVGVKQILNGKTDPTYINLDRKFPEQGFTVVLYGDTRKAFSYDPEIKLMNKTICVTGKIGAYKDVPQIVVTKENQVEVVE